jgi:hypothetical protein
VDIVDSMARPEVLTYRMAFANDWAEALGMTLSESIAADTLLPQTALSAPGNVLANLQQLRVVSATGTALQVDAGMAPPVGGGFEVRRREGECGVYRLAGELVGMAEGKKKMTEFEAQVLADLSVLKNQMNQVMGIGQPGRLTQLEERVERHERSVQRMKGLVGATGGLLTAFHLAIDYFRR